MSTTRLDTFSNSDHAQQRGSLVRRLLWYVTNAVFFQSTWLWGSALRRGLLRFFGAHVGLGVVIKPQVSIKYPWMLTLGDYTWVGEQVWIDNLTQVTVGAHCCLSQGAMLLTGSHDYKRSTFDLITGPIVLQDGVWVGARATVCPGVTVASHAVLAVGSVATHDLEPYTIYQGNPAQAKRKRTIHG